MKDLYEYSTPELVRMLGERFKEYRMRCDLTQKEVSELWCWSYYYTQVREWYSWQSFIVNIHSFTESDWTNQLFR